MSLSAFRETITALMESDNQTWVPVCQTVLDVIDDGLAHGLDSMPPSGMAQMIGQRVMLMLAIGSGGEGGAFK